MKKLDKNQKIGIISLSIFVVFIVVFSVLSSLVQSGSIPSFTVDQRIQGLLAFVIFLPICSAMFFWGKHFKSKDNKIGSILIFVSVALFIFGIIQVLLSLFGAYGA